MENPSAIAANPRENETNPSAIAANPRESESFAFRMENPFSLKVGQVFTGFGVGCGVGIGVGRPIYLGAIPALQQVMTAARGATDAFSGVGRHVNSSLKKIGMKNIEAGLGCGVGIGHGFGVGLALKPGVVSRVQSSVAQALVKIMMKFGMGPSFSSVQNVIPGSVQSSVNMLTGASTRSAQSSTTGVLDLGSKISGSAFQISPSDGSSHRESIYDLHKGTPSDTVLGSHTEKVIDSFLQSPLFQKDSDVELSELAGNLRTENNVLQVLLKHQQIIEELMEDNRKLHKILVEDLKVSPSKLQASNEDKIRFDYPCSDCYECRRRKRRAER